MKVQLLCLVRKCLNDEIIKLRVLNFFDFLDEPHSFNKERIYYKKLKIKKFNTIIFREFLSLVL